MDFTSNRHINIDFIGGWFRVKLEKPPITPYFQGLANPRVDFFVLKLSLSILHGND